MAASTHPTSGRALFRSGRQLSQLRELIRQTVRFPTGPAWEQAVDFERELAASIFEAVEYALSYAESDEHSSRLVPGSVLAQAGHAARAGVRLDDLIRAYVSADRVLGEYVVTAADERDREATQTIVRRQSAYLEHLLDALAEAYNAEVDRLTAAPERRLAEYVERLLLGRDEYAAARIGYRLDGFHVGIVGIGPRAPSTIEAVANALGHGLLLVTRETDVVWAWLGAPRELKLDEVEEVVARSGATDVALALGQPREGFAGWRRSHEEAVVTQAVARRRDGHAVTRCADFAAEAALLQSPDLAGLLVEVLLGPLSSLRLDGDVARQTLRQYVACSQNISSTAGALGVNRRTVEKRLRQISEALGQPLALSISTIDLALRLEALGVPAGGKAP
jgi:hypothetical protein